MGSGEYALRSLLNNKKAVGMGVFQLPGSNALAVSQAVRARMAELKTKMPEGVDYAIAYDPTVFVDKSIEAVIHTLIEAILLVVLVVVVTVGPIGLLVGTAAGYAGGALDTVLMRVTDIFLAFPRLILALAFVAALGPGIENAVIAIAFTAWPPYARVARAEAMVIRNADFIAATRLQGASPLRIVLRHVMPLCVPSLIVRSTLDMAGIILTAAGLGFLGLGAQPPMPEWGAMIATGRDYIFDQWWVATMPGIAICVVALGFNLLGDGLRDVLDPKQGQ